MFCESEAVLSTAKCLLQYFKTVLCNEVFTKFCSFLSRKNCYFANVLRDEGVCSAQSLC